MPGGRPDSPGLVQLSTAIALARITRAFSPGAKKPPAWESRMYRYPLCVRVYPYETAKQ
jgi:hypothetical protein